MTEHYEDTGELTTSECDTRSLPVLTLKRSPDYNMLRMFGCDEDGKQTELIAINMLTGDIEYGEHYTPDEAAQTFWEVMTRYSPQALLAQIAELEAEIAERDERDLDAKVEADWRD